jgi:hypothetical protein
VQRLKDVKNKEGAPRPRVNRELKNPCSLWLDNRNLLGNWTCHRSIIIFIKSVGEGALRTPTEFCKYGHSRVPEALNHISSSTFRWTTNSKYSWLFQYQSEFCKYGHSGVPEALNHISSLTFGLATNSNIVGYSNTKATYQFGASARYTASCSPVLIEGVYHPTIQTNLQTKPNPELDQLEFALLQNTLHQKLYWGKKYRSFSKKYSNWPRTTHHLLQWWSRTWNSSSLSRHWRWAAAEAGRPWSVDNSGRHRPSRSWPQHRAARKSCKNQSINSCKQEINQEHRIKKT